MMGGREKSREGGEKSYKDRERGKSRERQRQR